MLKRIVPISYTSRNFDSIKRDLVEHAKRYYEDSFKDFSQAGFGSLMLDSVSYVGDILSFYLDYQANECFLDTATEFNNVIKLGKQLGYKYYNVASSAGVATFYIAVPALGAAMDTKYIPTLKAGSVFSSRSGTSFILTEDVKFNSKNNEKRVLRTDTNNKPITYAIKSRGNIISGRINSEVISFEEFEKFKKIKLSTQNIVEILSVIDSEGNEYYEVEYLTQNIVYKSISNRDINTSTSTREILKPFLAPRRFVVERDFQDTYLQFGGTSDSVIEDEKMMAEPASTVIQMHGKKYISNTSFDPSIILNNDKFGMAPSNTSLTVTYRYLETANNINFGVDSITNVTEAKLEFVREEDLLTATKDLVISSLEVTNEDPILGSTSTLDSQELKLRMQSTFSSQDRAVTLQDYKSLVYNMPSKYGSIKRVNAIRDDDSLKRNLNLYILSEDENGNLCEPNQILKNNLKTWLSSRRMINDSIDILSGKIINIGIEFIAIAGKNRPKYDILSDAITQLKLDFKRKPDFGETFMYNEVYSSLKKIQDIIDVKEVKIIQKNGNKYSITNFDIEKATVDDRFINVPANCVLEIKYPNIDIKGTIL